MQCLISYANYSASATTGRSSNLCLMVSITKFVENAERRVGVISIRIYNNGSYVVNNIHPDHIDDHVDYNKTFRFGCALVVDGEIKNEGYLEKDRILDILNKIDLSNYKSYSELPYR